MVNTQYLVLHQSCRNRPGIAVVQAVHAATESLKDAPAQGDTYVCVLVADTSDQLRQIHANLIAGGIKSTLIEEPDPPYNGAAVALGTEVLERAILKPYFVGLLAF